MQAEMAGVARDMMMYENPVAGPKVLHSVTNGNDLSSRLVAQPAR
jgi:hypothetical protein